MTIRKSLLIIATMFAFSAITLALEPTEYSVFKRLNNDKIQKSLTKYLQTDREQTESLNYIFSLTERKMTNALKKEDMEAAENAMWFNLANAKNILSENQYKKYLVVLNLTINSNELDILAEN